MISTRGMTYAPKNINKGTKEIYIMSYFNTGSPLFPPPPILTTVCKLVK